MSPSFIKIVAIALAGVASVQATSSCPKVTSQGEPAGTFKDVNGTQIYHTGKSTNNTKAILYISDIYGVPLLENKLLADSLASANYRVIFPDLFGGDAIPVVTPEKGLNLTEWRSRHGPEQVDAILAKTINYMKSSLGVTRIGAVGYCFGGKYVVRTLAEGKGVDVGFIAHPSALEIAEVEAVSGRLSIAAGQLDAAFDTAFRRTTEDKLIAKGSLFQSTVYAQAPHGFAVRPNVTIPAQVYAKEASFLQAVTWFDAWL